MFTFREHQENVRNIIIGHLWMQAAHVPLVRSAYPSDMWAVGSCYVSPSGSGYRSSISSS